MLTYPYSFNWSKGVGPSLYTHDLIAPQPEAIRCKIGRSWGPFMRKTSTKDVNISKYRPQKCRDRNSYVRRRSILHSIEFFIECNACQQRDDFIFKWCFISFTRDRNCLKCVNTQFLEEKRAIYKLRVKLYQTSTFTS